MSSDDRKDQATDIATGPAVPASVVHVYDDIQEEDNRLPNWWLFILFGSMVFAFGYWFVYQTTAMLPNPRAEYDARVAAMIAERIRRNPTSSEALLAAAHDPSMVEAGHAVFTTMCASCHGKNAEGIIGPNLTDRYWIHGGQPTDILKSMTEGYPEKGMPQWGRLLGDEKMRQIAAFVISVRNTNQPSTRPPQGTAVD